MRSQILTWAIVAIAALAPASTLASEAEDKAIAQQIATVLRDSGQMKNYSVGVKYRNGTVWLSGRVTDQRQLKTALAIVSNLEGVENIVNGMEVDGSQGGLQQPGAKSMARRTSYSEKMGAASNAVLEQPTGVEQGGAVPAGFHGKHAPYMRPMAMYGGGPQAGPPAAMDNPYMPNYSWPSYASYPNYAALQYPKQYSASAFPYIGPFYPYPQVPLGWRKVSLEWDDGWWFLDFHDRGPY
jgi:hypothetical protein